MNINLHKYDLPENIILGNVIAIDTEAMGLNNIRDRLCVIQISDNKGDIHVIHFPTPNFECKILRKILSDKDVLKIMHYARFDIAILQHYLKIRIDNIFCTKIASKLTRTYTDNHSLRHLCDDLLNVKLSKQETCSDWGAENLTPEQINYAANDVIHLHKLMDILKVRLKREKRLKIAEGCFKFIPTRAQLDILGWGEEIISH